MKVTAVLLMLLMAGAVVAQDYDEPAPGRRRRGWSPLSTTLSIGLIASYNLEYKVEDSAGNEIGGGDMNDSYVGLSGRFYALMGGKLGIGLDMILLDSYDDGTYMSYLWQVDVDILLRVPLTRRLLATAGIGYSQMIATFEDPALDSESSDVGYNLKLGAEYFLSRSISITGEFKWTRWDIDPYTYTILSFQAGVHYSF